MAAGCIGPRPGRRSAEGPGRGTAVTAAGAEARLITRAGWIRLRAPPVPASTAGPPGERERRSSEDADAGVAVDAREPGEPYLVFSRAPVVGPGDQAGLDELEPVEEPQDLLP